MDCSVCFAGYYCDTKGLPFPKPCEVVSTENSFCFSTLPFNLHPRLHEEHLVICHILYARQTRRSKSMTWPLSEGVQREGGGGEGVVGAQDVAKKVLKTK